MTLRIPGIIIGLDIIHIRHPRSVRVRDQSHYDLHIPMYSPFAVIAKYIMNILIKKPAELLLNTWWGLEVERDAISSSANTPKELAPDLLIQL